MGRLGWDPMIADKNTEAILENLKELGFTEYEGKVYICLISEHPLSAYSISKASGVPHSRVYDITRRLIKRGFVTSKGTSPELFSPLAPEEMINRIIKKNEKVTDKLKKQLASINFIPDFDPVWNISDSTEVMEIACRIIDESKETLFLGVWNEELEILEPSLRRASERGVKVYVLVYGYIKLDFGIVQYHSMDKLEDDEEVGHSLDLVSDGKECLTGGLGAVVPCHIVWTRHKGLINSIEGYIIHDFYIAEVISSLGEETEKLFGKNFKKLREKYSY